MYGWGLVEVTKLAKIYVNIYISSKFNGETRQIGCLFAGISVKFGGRYMPEAGILPSCSITRRIVPVIYDLRLPQCHGPYV